MNLTVLELADFLCGRLLAGNAGHRVCGFASLDEATEEDVAFFALEGYRAKLATTGAGVVLVPSDFEGSVPEGVALIAVSEPSQAFSSLVEKYAPPRPKSISGIHPSAVVDPSAQLGERVCISPNAVVGAGAVIGDRSEIGAGAVIGEGAVLGADCIIHSNATVAWGCVLGSRVILHSGCVVGADGFGYEFVDVRHRKVEQLGIVEIADDVEIGACSTIDRARFGRTRIGEGTKIDNQVQVGHNAVIGKHCIIVAGGAIAGSCLIGDYVTMAAQVGVAGHLQITDKVVLGARAGVTKSIQESGMYFGFPHQPAAVERKQIAAARKVTDLLARLKALEKAVKAQAEGS
ncbi:MAG: UDP-3-O-(3-hydroxymyristoyl)glucosamine N-acyltransferase [Verrucomicrobiales bacterium]